MTNYKLIHTDNSISKVRFQPWPENFENPEIGVERLNVTHMKSNTDQSGTIKYQYNDYGYRSHYNYDDILYGSEDYIACIGCSMTEGIAVEYEKTWSYLLGKKLGLPVINLGLTSAGIDYCLYQYYNLHFSDYKIKKPIQTFILKPPYNRFSICNSEEFTFFQDWNFINEWVTENNGLYYKIDKREAQVIKSTNANQHTIDYSKFTSYYKTQEFLIDTLESTNNSLHTMKWDAFGEDWNYAVDNLHFDYEYHEKIFKEFYKKII